jgi:prolipoprotein diacylglyceryl transferase
MPVAFLPSPSRAVWYLGPVPFRAYALCVVAGIAVGLWVANRRYLRIGGRTGLILDAAALAVPLGLIGARVYGVVTDYQMYFGRGQDWTNVFRIWDGALGFPGAIAGGALGAWIACRREGAALAPVAGAVAPGLAFAQAIGRWGNWFNQQLYGRPSSLPWAVEISPVHRIAGYENFATFQPTFLYESLWDAAVGVAVIFAARRLLSGDRVFAVYCGLYAVGRFWTESLRIDRSPHLFGLRVDQVVMIVVVLGAATYLYLTRHERGPGVLARRDGSGWAGAGGATGAVAPVVGGSRDGGRRAGQPPSAPATSFSAADSELNPAGTPGIREPLLAAAAADRAAHRDGSPAPAGGGLPGRRHPRRRQALGGQAFTRMMPPTAGRLI